jgi:ankyrin repeat protein
MSKEAIEIAEPIELKELYIRGPRIGISPATMKLLADRKDCLIIDGEKQDITPEYIKHALEERNVKIGAGTRIDINAHGLRVNKQHVIGLGKDSVLTKDFFADLRKLAGTPLYVHLWSCYAGTSSKEVVSLGDSKEGESKGAGSILVTHVEGKETSSVRLADYSINASLTRYLDSENTKLTPYQQFIFDLPENYETTTFSQVVDAAKDAITRYKSSRIPKEYTMAEILISIEKEKALKDFFNKFFTEQEDNFKKTFSKEIEVTGINHADTTTQLTAQTAKDYATGILTHVSGLTGDITYKLKKEQIATLIQKLQNKGVDINSSVSGMNALSWASIKGNNEIVLLLLEKGADVNIADNDERCTPLQYAISERHQDIVKLLLENKADPDKADNNNQTPLQRAISQGSQDIVKLLLENKADPDKADNNGYTPLCYAVSQGNEAIIELLLKNKADLNKADNNNKTPLQRAISQGSQDIGKLLLENKANPNIVDNDGYTPLCYAVSQGNEAIIELLLKNKADLNKANDNGETPLSLAINKNNQNIVRLLLKNNANPNIADKDGFTPLHHAY